MYTTNPSSIKPSLVKVTLKTLGAFMSWIPLGYIFETGLIMKLITNLLPEGAFRVETIKCLSEIASLRGPTTLSKEYEEMALMIFIRIVEKMEQIIQGVVLSEEYHHIAPKQLGGYESFCQQFAMLLSTFLQHHIDLIEATVSTPSGNPEAINALIMKTRQALIYLVQLSNIPNDEIFKVCVEFWNFLATRVYTTTANETMGSSGLLLGYSAKNTVITVITDEIFPVVMENHISKMPRPKEVLVIEDESGNVIQESYKDTESISLYETMKKTLITLAILDGKSMTNIILKILNQIVFSFI
jgi:exportin-1